ncbi:MAG: FAD-dependent oxidoreductase [Crocinitomicaceae bacterium]
MNKIIGVILFLLVYQSLGYSQTSKRVAIIGGGMSGISAANSILKADSSATITIYEKEAILGGNAQSVAIPNENGEIIYVDAGPQYFAEGPWDQYIQFLKDFNLYDPDGFSSFEGSFVINSGNSNSPNYVSPANGSLRGGKLSQSLQFLKFYKAANKICVGKTRDYPAHIGDWVESLKTKKEFNTEVVYPFLASSLGTTIDEIKGTDTREIVSLFAFRKALKKGNFLVSKEGMGTLINHAGNSLSTMGVEIKTSSPVNKVQLINNGVSVSANGVTETFDFVVFATHPYQAAKLIDENELKKTLNKFEYFKAHIVLHSDSTFVNNERVSFLNIKTNVTNSELISNTMNLSVVNSMYAGIYKSWLQTDDVDRVKANGTFLHEVIFSHPMITPEFKMYLIELKKLENNYPNIYFAGGWSEGLETQETAIISGQKASEKYQSFMLKK